MIKQTYIKESLAMQQIKLPKNHHILSVEVGFHGQPAITFLAAPGVNGNQVTEPVTIEQYQRGDEMDLRPQTERIYLGSYFSQVKNSTIYVFKKIN